MAVQPELEVWVGPIFGGWQAVVLFNRVDIDSEQITVHWTDIGFPTDHSAAVRDLWARKDWSICNYDVKYYSYKIDEWTVISFFDWTVDCDISWK